MWRATFGGAREPKAVVFEELDREFLQQVMSDIDRGGTKVWETYVVKTLENGACRFSCARNWTGCRLLWCVVFVLILVLFLNLGFERCGVDNDAFWCPRSRFLNFAVFVVFVFIRERYFVLRLSATGGQQILLDLDTTRRFEEHSFRLRKCANRSRFVGDAFIQESPPAVTVDELWENWPRRRSTNIDRSVLKILYRVINMSTTKSYQAETKLRTFLKFKNRFSKLARHSALGTQ